MGAVTILVEMQFGGTWTDVTSYLESEIQVSGGRQDELSQADANQCSFSLDNLDGRFTPGKSTGAYYPNVKVGVPVRVSASLDGGLTMSRRFTGFVDSWQLTWDDDIPRVQVSATSIMARLGLLSERKSAIEEEIIADGPAAYYTLGEAAGSLVAYDESGNSTQEDLVLGGNGAAPVFGTAAGPSADGLTAAQFYGKQYLYTSTTVGNNHTMECFFSVPSGAVSGGSIWLFQGAGSALGVTGARINGTTNAIEILLQSPSGSAGVSLGTGVGIDGLTHHLAVVISYSSTTGQFTRTTYLDGAQVDTATPVTAATPTSPYFYVGLPDTGVTLSQPVVIAHAAIHNSAVPSARIADRYAAGMNGFSGDTIAARIARYATWGRISSGYSTSSTALIAADSYDGASLVDLLHNLEITEGGVLYDERDGTLTLKTRQSRYVATTAAGFDVTAQQVESSFTPTTDRQGLTNDVTVTTAAGASASVTDTASIAAYGVARAQIDTLALDAQDPLARAQWELAAHSTPKERVPSLGVDFLNCGLSTSTLLALTAGSRVAVTNPPSQAAGPGDYFIEGWSETFDPTSYMTTFNVSPAQPWVNAFIEDDATKGVLDSTYVLAY